MTEPTNKLTVFVVDDDADLAKSQAWLLEADGVANGMAIHFEKPRLCLSQGFAVIDDKDAAGVVVKCIGRGVHNCLKIPNIPALYFTTPGI